MGYSKIEFVEPAELDKYFQFPLWDTLLCIILLYLEKSTFNSLYGIPITINSIFIIISSASLSIPFMGYMQTFTIFHAQLNTNFQFPLWDTLLNIHGISFIFSKYFQFPLWDTMVQMMKKIFPNTPFNSLYGILCKHCKINEQLGLLFQFPLWDTLYASTTSSATPSLSIPFMGYMQKK